MVTKIIDGHKIAQSIKLDLQAEVERLKVLKIKPCLAVILVGDDPASKSYVASKKKACGELGIISRDYQFPVETSRDVLLKLIESLNQEKEVHGILVQLPLPQPLSEQEILGSLNPLKDVDGFSPINMGKLVLGQPTFLPCTPYGVLKIFEYEGIEVCGKYVVIIGRSNIVGKPLANLLLQKSPKANATITVCHSHTKDLKHFTLQADILIAAVGSPGLIKPDMIQEGTVVIDVGINRVFDPTKPKGYRLQGDVDYAGLQGKASYLTPVPGGVGPLTVTMLLANTIQAAKQQAGLSF